jgi:DNA modification methylase
MFSFVGDTVLDPFAGSGSTAVAAIRAGRSSISLEIEREYLSAATQRAVRELELAPNMNHTPRIIEPAVPPKHRARWEEEFGVSAAGSV